MFGCAEHIPRFKDEFPELEKIDREELANRFRRLKMDFYYEKKEPVTLITRLSLPFALITMLMMILFLPINFILSGQWGYKLGKKNVIYNWFKSLRLLNL